MSCSATCRANAGPGHGGRNLGELNELGFRVFLQGFLLDPDISIFGIPACELTDTYSPAAIDNAPAASPAIPDNKIVAGLACVVAMPNIRLLVEIRPSLAPRTAARNQPLCWLRWGS